MFTLLQQICAAPGHVWTLKIESWFIPYLENDLQSNHPIKMLHHFHFSITVWMFRFPNMVLNEWIFGSRESPPSTGLSSQNVWITSILTLCSLRKGTKGTQHFVLAILSTRIIYKRQTTWIENCRMSSLKKVWTKMETNCSFNQ